MVNRSRRTEIFKILFQTEFQKDVDIDELIELYDSSNDMPDKEREIITDKLRAIVAHIDTIDSKIEEVSSNWRINRIGKAELAILRLSIYEILFEEGNEDAITADEAVRLAKEYVSGGAPQFVNGIIGTVIRGKEKA